MADEGRLALAGHHRPLGEGSKPSAVVGERCDALA